MMAREQAREQKGDPERNTSSTTCRSAAQAMLAGVVLLGVCSTQIAWLPASAAECAPPAPGEPMFITENCVDPRFNNPSCSDPELRTDPVPHYWVSCEFVGTDARFVMAFPLAEQYDGRFFQSTHQLFGDPPVIPGTDIEFGVDSGAYYVRTNMGGSENCQTNECSASGLIDPAIGGYRVNAAAAKHSRVVAAELYGAHRPYGYLYGGSGGSYQSISSSEHSLGVWDGFVPYVMPSSNAVPTTLTVRFHALRVLKQRNRFPCIMNAIDPGGSGDPVASCDLNEEEAGALREATLLGFSPRGWWDHATQTLGALSLVAGLVPLLDPGYFDDYWSEPGYLGHDDPFGTVAAARIQDAPGDRFVTAVSPPLIFLDALPAGDVVGADLIVDTGASAGQVGTIFTAIPGLNAVFALGVDTTGMAFGDQVRIDNSRNLALQTYQRHQVPGRDLYGWNQFRENGKGEPIYPQRDVLVGPISAFAASGSLQSGDVHGKMILVQNLMDIDALPWQADWYRTKVKEALGRREMEERFRLYFTDHAQHGSPSPTNTPAFARTINYSGVIQQALRDVSAWAERGVTPPRNTHYWVDHDTQVQVPPLFGLLRGGMQPVVTLLANGRERADIEVGDTVTFHALISTPPGAGKVVAAEWDFLGVGDYPVAQPTADLLRSTVLLKQSYTFTEPGTYFPVLRATSHRQSDAETPFARVQNLGRVRVVVE